MYDALSKLNGTFYHIAEMKIRKPTVMGKVCKKIAKHLLTHYAKAFSSGEPLGDKKEERKSAVISLKKDDMKC